MSVCERERLCVCAVPFTATQRLRSLYIPPSPSSTQQPPHPPFSPMPPPLSRSTYEQRRSGTHHPSAVRIFHPHPPTSVSKVLVSAAAALQKQKKKKKKGRRRRMLKQIVGHTHNFFSFFSFLLGSFFLGGLQSNLTAIRCSRNKNETEASSSKL